MDDHVTLKEHIETLIDANNKRYEQRFNDTKIAVDAALIAADKAVAAALAGQKEAVTKAEVAAEKRFESVNEFRNTLSDQQRLLLPRLEAETKFDFLSKGIDANSKEIANLRESRSESAGKTENSKDVWGYVVGFLGVLLAIGSMLLRAFGH